MKPTPFPRAAPDKVMPELKIVRARNASGTYYALRYEKDEIEHELMASMTLGEVERVKAWATNNDTSSADIVVMLAALYAILPLARSIAMANLDQGNAGYATKSHMSAWGDEIFLEARAALTFLGLVGEETA